MATSKKISEKRIQEIIAYKDKDLSDLPELTDLQVMELKPRYPEHFKAIKKSIQMRIDSDVLAFFKSFGPGYQTRINAVLRNYMLQVRK